MLLTLSTLLMIFGGYLWFLKAPAQFPQQPSSANADLLKPVLAAFQSEIVFDSNRSGRFGIYRKSLEEEQPRVVIDTPEAHEMYPDPSPNGELLVYAKHSSLERGNPGEIWLTDVNGRNPRKLADQGTFPTFNAAGTHVYFERDRRRLMQVPIEGGEAVELFPAQHDDWKRFMIVKPRVSPDGKYVFFTTDRSGRWNAYWAHLESGESGHVGRGCEPAPFKATDKVAWITKSHVLSKSGVGVYDRGTNSRGKLHDAGPPYGHEYFPTLAKEDTFLLYAACPGSQHDHNTANYQLFIRDLRNDTVVRVTHDTHTNRWPKALPAAGREQS